MLIAVVAAFAAEIAVVIYFFLLLLFEGLHFLNLRLLFVILYGFGVEAIQSYFLHHFCGLIFKFLQGFDLFFSLYHVAIWLAVYILFLSHEKATISFAEKRVEFWDFLDCVRLIVSIFFDFMLQWFFIGLLFLFGLMFFLFFFYLCWSILLCLFLIWMIGFFLIAVWV